jgi:hypothetical protein
MLFTLTTSTCKSFGDDAVHEDVQPHVHPVPRLSKFNHDDVACSLTTNLQMRSTAVEEDDPARRDLYGVEGDEGTGEPVDPDPVVPTVGAN